VTIDARSFGDRYARVPETRRWDRHPLIEATLAHVGVPEGVSCEVAIDSAMPAAASTGTSAAVAVALVGALVRLAGRDVTPQEAARTAHHIEAAVLGQQSGVQDQIAAAYGGINVIEIDAYPDWRVSRLPIPETTWTDLEHRLVLIYLGHGHRSTDVHEAVIRRLQAEGDDARALDDLRRAAGDARDAVLAGDLDGLGRAMQANTDAQVRLHADLVSDETRRLIEVARAHGAAGWKVNGAGGDGGSLTVLLGDDADTVHQLLADAAAAVPSSRCIPIRLAREGLRVTATDEHEQA
jgi:D-glycero-alpha-D-manno-heptose-7-phosphate kinase